MGDGIGVVSTIRWALKPKHEVRGVDYSDVLVVVEGPVEARRVEVGQDEMVSVVGGS